MIKYKIVLNNRKIFFLLLIVAIALSIVWLWKLVPSLFLNSKFLRPDFPKGIFVASSNGITNLIYNSFWQRYEIKAQIKSIAPRQLVMLDGYIFCYENDKIYRFDQNFTTSISKHLGIISAIAASDKNVYVAAEQKFIILNKDLEKLSSISLFPSIEKHKEVHSILIYNNIAYLLDNLIIPIYLFRIDISDSQSPKIIETVAMVMKYGHAGDQWINPILNQWLISYRTNWDGHYIHIAPLDKYLKKKTIYQSYRWAGDKEMFDKNLTWVTYWEHLESDRDRFADGEYYNVLGIVPFPPIWAIVHSCKDQKHHLVEISSQKEKISFIHSLYLDDFEYSFSDVIRDMSIKFKNSYLFVTPGIKIKLAGWRALFEKFSINDFRKKEELELRNKKDISLLKIIDVKGKPRILFSIDLNMYGIDAITDILPY